MGEAESELLRNSELGTGAPGRAVTFPRSHSSSKGRPGQELPAQGPLTANPPAPTPQQGQMLSLASPPTGPPPLPCPPLCPDRYPLAPERLVGEGWGRDADLGREAVRWEIRNPRSPIPPPPPSLQDDGDESPGSGPELGLHGPGGSHSRGEHQWWGGVGTGTCV